MSNFDNLPDSALVRLKDLLAPRGPLPFSKSTLWAGCKTGRFPQPIRIGRITAWRVNDVRQFLASLGISEPAPTQTARPVKHRR